MNLQRGIASPAIPQIDAMDQNRGSSNMAEAVEDPVTGRSSGRVVANEDFNKQKMAKILRAFLLAKYLRNDSVPAELEQGLYLGSIGAAFNKGLLQNLNVTHILAVAGGVDMPFPRDFKYTRIEVLDSAEVDLAQHFERCFAFIDEARMNGGAVLVHCFAGRSRSVTVAVAYLMKKYGMRFPQALAHVTSRRKEAQPNPGFLRQLQAFDQQLELARKSIFSPVRIFLSDKRTQELQAAAAGFLIMV
ncbi:hypothetical protein R1sor_003756 [Riccia sorocarpa]|uniref:Dual specificity protein phosphatase 1 n=1 Tax=Riccia sorocarpa TaxID=122646 RepID=A0ABD3H6F9_9MARC